MCATDERSLLVQAVQLGPVNRGRAPLRALSELRFVIPGAQWNRARSAAPSWRDARPKGVPGWQLHLPVPADLVPEKDDAGVWYRLRPEADDWGRAVTDLDRRAPGLRLPTAEYAGSADEGLW